MSDIFRDFDKKNEIPKVKIPKFATSGICNDAIFPKIDAFSQIDEIVKDITKKKDNAIAMEFTKCIGELLRKNGVAPKVTEYTHESVRANSIEHRYGASIDELDFSEHDKVFEDKIADLQQRIRELIKEKDEYKRKCNNFGFENQKLKQRIAELESKNNQLTESILRKETKIHELESEKTEKPRKCTAVIVAKEINGQTYVTLDDFMSVVNDFQAEIGT